MKNLYIVILAGGVGTRLWPMSSQKKPKQFQKLVSEKTMLQETFERVRFVEPDHIFVATNEDYIGLVHEQLPQVPFENLIPEPSLQDTGPCIGLAAALVHQKDPDAVMAVVYADHLVQDQEEFEQKICATAKLAHEENTLNIIEVKATAPNTNLGYVKIGKQLKEQDGIEVHEFLEFKEKPDYATAKQFLSSRDYLWNTGFYIWRTEAILKEFEKHMPKTYKALKAIQEGGSIEEHYPTCDKISIDYGIMEKVDPKQVRIIPADLGWSDIGTWEALHQELAEKPESNIKKGKVTIVDGEGNLIYNEGSHHIAAFGLKDMIIVHSDGKTLICPKNRSADLKQLIKEIND